MNIPYPEGNGLNSQDNEIRLLQKIRSLLSGGASSAPSVRASSNSGVKTSADALPDNPNRKSFSLQNYSSSPLIINGNGWQEVLKACSSTADGSGGFLYDNEYTGYVTCSGSSVYYSVTEYESL